MKPETKKRAWLLSVALTLWLSSLFIHQTIVADPRYAPDGVWGVEFFVCIFAILFAVAALVLHAKKSAARLIISLVLLCAAIACFLNTRVASSLMYKDWSPANVTVTVDEVGPVQVGFGDFNSDGEFFVTVKIDNQEAIDSIKGLRLSARYNDLLGRMVDFHTEEYRSDRGEWFFDLPPCFSGKELTVVVRVTTVDNKVHAKSVTVKVPKKPIWG